MNKQQLKNSILQWAIQGKLVPQIASEGTAEDLLKEIRAEKERLVKEGKLKKKDLEVKPIEDDEVPFEIPDSWRWVRLEDIGLSQLGKTKNPNQSRGSLFKYLCSRNVYWTGVDLTTMKEMLFDENEILKYQIRKGDLIVCEGGDCGRSAIWDKEETVLYQNALHRIRFYCGISQYYIMHCLFLYGKNGYIQKFINGETIKHLVKSQLDSMLFPLPPLSEQKRIVAKIEELMPLIEDYGKAQERLEDLNKALPEKLKKSILQEAIMGKLVPQDPKEGTADELLAEIRKEKERLVKEGKLKKKDLEVKPIEDDEVPFEIPDSWRWVRLKDICVKIVDGDHNPPVGVPSKTDYMMLSSKNINYDKIVDLDSVRYLDKEVFDIENQRTLLTNGDILFTSVGTLGRSCVFKGESLNICFQRSVSVLTTLIYNQYLKRYLDSPFVQSFVMDNATGTAQKGFYLNQLEKLLVALPPFVEQKRIVEKVDSLMSII